MLRDYYSVLRLVALPALLFCAISLLYADPPPTVEQQTAMLASMARYAQHYESNIPNFLCVEVVEQFTSSNKGKRWHRGDTLTSQLAFSEGRERHTLELVNDKAVKSNLRPSRRPLTTEGEFGPALGAIFADTSDASFQWNRWDTLRGHRVGVFDYSIDKQHSALKLSVSDLATAIVPYRGSVAADPNTGAVWQVSYIASNLPSELHENQIATTVDYDTVTISTGQYLLPIHASVVLSVEDKLIRNEMTFRDYRKFSAESSLKFDTAGSSDRQQNKPALPQP